PPQAREGITDSGALPPSLAGEGWGGGLPRAACCCVRQLPLTPAGAAQQLGQFADALPLFATIDRVLNIGGAGWGQDGPRQLAELVADLGFGERLVEIAAMALGGVCRLAAVAEGYGDARR